MPQHLYAIGGTLLEATIALPELDKAADGEPEFLFEVLFAATHGPDPDRWIRQWDMPDEAGRPWALFGRIGGEWLIRFLSLAEFHLSPDARHIRCRPQPGIPDSTIRHLLLDQVLPMALGHRGRFALHASAIVLDGQGIGIVGDSGSGKSTLAGAFAGWGAELLADDCLLATEVGGQWQVFPYYPGLRLWPESADKLGVGQAQTVEVAHYTRKLRVGEGPGLPFRRTAAPLRGLFLLSDNGEEISVRRIPAHEAFQPLVETSYQLDTQDAPALKTHLETIGRIADAIPCHILCYPYRFDVLPRVRELMLDCLGMGSLAGKPCKRATPD